ATMQAKLLRVLQEEEVVPVGDTRPRKVDVRVISATNRDLSAELAQRRFREDLYYRLAAFPIRIPPLRERREDIPLLADHFLAIAAEHHRKWIRGLEPAALERLMRFDWPGNVRELSNEMERSVALARDGETIGIEQLSMKLRQVQASGSGWVDSGANTVQSFVAGEGAEPAGPLRQARAAFEARYIAEALKRQGKNVSRTAQTLGISRVMLQKKMKAYGLR
ncbi:MAG: sigma 54-interacting transcriptional regulator, partial [Burkholderiales bacterium]